MKLIALYAFLLAVAVSAADSDSIKFRRLYIRIDSLTATLKAVQDRQIKDSVAADYAREMVAAYKDAGSNQTSQYLGFVSSTVLVLLAGFAGIGWFLNKRSKDERDYVADQVVRTLTPTLNAQLAPMNERISTLAGEVVLSAGKLMNFTEEAGSKLALIDMLPGILKRLGHLEMRSSGDVFKSVMAKVAEGYANKNLTVVMNSALRGLKDSKAGPAGGMQDLFYEDYVTILAKVFGEAKAIRTDSQTKFYEHVLHLTEEDKAKLTGLVEKLPIDDLVPLDSPLGISKEGVI